MVAPLLAAVGINQAGNLAGGMLNSWVNYAASKKLMKKQFDLNKKMWELNNEYNLPVNQMQRLQDAGLNPHLVYGNGGASATASLGSSTSQGHFNADFNFNPLGDLASYQSIMNNEANTHYTNVQATQAELTGKKQRELMDAQINEINKRAQLTHENATTQSFLNTIPHLLGVQPSGNAGDVRNVAPTAFDNFFNFLGDMAYAFSGYNKFQRMVTGENARTRGKGASPYLY